MSGIRTCFQSHPEFAAAARGETRLRYLQPHSIETMMTSFPFTILDLPLFALGLLVPLLLVLVVRVALRALAATDPVEVSDGGDTTISVGAPLREAGRVHDRARERVRQADGTPYPALRLEQGLRPDPMAGFVSDVGELHAVSQG